MIEASHMEGQPEWVAVYGPGWADDFRFTSRSRAIRFALEVNSRPYVQRYELDELAR